MQIIHFRSILFLNLDIFAALGHLSPEKIVLFIQAMIVSSPMNFVNTNKIYDGPPPYSGPIL